MKDVDPKIRKEICEALNKAAVYLHQQAREVVNDPEFCDLEEMYRGDANDYESILNSFINGRYEEAAKSFCYMDTASRDHIWGVFMTVEAYEAFSDLL